MRYRIFLVGLGLFFWTIGLHFANSNIWRNEEAHDINRALEWIQTTKLSDHGANLFVGSSNTACSFDPRQLDSLSIADRWYNLGQPGMTDFELVDFALHLVQDVDPDEVNALFIEVIAQDVTKWTPDWRNVRIMDCSSAIKLLGTKLNFKSEGASQWDSVRLFIQFILMKWSAPIHNWLHAAPADWNESRRGYRTQGELRRTDVKSEVAKQILHMRQAQLDGYRAYLESGEIEAQAERVRLAFPMKRLALLLEKATSKGIKVHLFSLLTEKTEHLHAAITQNLRCSVFMPSCNRDISILVDPRFLRDPLHLNKEGAHEMGRLLLNEYSTKLPH